MQTAPNQNDSRLAHLGAFVHSRLDELALDVYQFRVYCHLLRRANGKSQCNPCIRTIAKLCLISVRKVQEVLCQLVALGFIKRQPQLADHGGPTSDLFTIFGIPPGAPYAPPLVQDVHHPGAPSAYKGNPIEGYPIHTRVGQESVSLSPKRQRPTQLLKSEELPSAFCELTKKHTAATLSASWTLVRQFYQHFARAHTIQHLQQCVEAFAAAIQARSSFYQQAIDYLALYGCDPATVECRIRSGELLPASSAYWTFIGHLQSQQAKPSLRITPDPVVEEEAARHAAAKEDRVTPDQFRQLRKEKAS